MKQSIIYICLIVISTSCIPTDPSKNDRVSLSANNPGAITIFFTGNELGALKPCGCSGGQLGGLDRRSAVFDLVPEENRLIVDTGTLVETESQQDLIKFKIFIQAFSLLGYDLVSFSEKDLEIIRNNFGSLDDFSSILNIIAPAGPSGLNAPAKFTQRFVLINQTIDVSIASVDVNSTPIEFIDNAYFSSADNDDQAGIGHVNILILNRCDPELIDSIAEKAPAVDCLVCPPASDEPMLTGDPNNRPLAFSIGRKGRYISKLHIDTTSTDHKPKLSFEFRAVSEDLEQNINLINLYKDYQQLVKEQNLLDPKNHPRFPMPDGLRYAGSESCNPCHQFAYVAWMGQPHAMAYTTLEEVGSQYDPECVQCHVVGLDYESGFVSEVKTPLMKDVGCEVCHGAGSKHNAHPNEIKMPIAEPNSVCIDCHTPEHSGDYAGHEKEKLQLIDHWTEPNAVSDVKL
jgi:hypothetical protein